MVSETRKQSMAWMETDYSKHTYFRWKIKWRLEHLGAPGIMGERPVKQRPIISQPAKTDGFSASCFARKIRLFSQANNLATTGLTVQILESEWSREPNTIGLPTGRNSTCQTGLKPNSNSTKSSYSMLISGNSKSSRRTVE